MLFATTMVFSGLSLEIPENQISKDTIKNLNPKYNLKSVSEVKVNAGSVRKKYRAKYRRGKGAGNCWTTSAILYKKLKRSGKKVRIVQYRTSLSSRHRSVQIYRHGKWVDFNYRGNGYAMLYRATKHKSGMHVVK
ncbi:MAG: hypothetical protein ABFD07_20200 [Methanobacterium sp.]